MTSQVARLPSVEPPAVAASPERHPAAIYEKSKSHWSDASSEPNEGEQSRGEREKKVASGASGPHSFLGLSLPSRATADARRVVSAAPTATAAPHVHRQAPGYGTPARTPAQAIAARAVERDSLGGEFISLSTGTSRPIPHSDGGTEHAVLDPVPERPLSIASASSLPRDKASRILGISHRRSMEPIPASNRTSMVSTRSAPVLPAVGPTLPLTSLYLVSGLPKSPQTWTLSDPDSVLGLHHSEGAANRWWRPEVLGSTVSPGAGGGKKGLKKKQSAELLKGGGVLSKQEVGRMLSKALKLSFTREVEIIASTLQPASTIHTFTFNVPGPSNPYGSSPSGDLLRNSVFTTASAHATSSAHGHAMAPYATGNSLYPSDPYARPSTSLLGPPSVLGRGAPPLPAGARGVPSAASGLNEGGITYHGVCLTVWSHADAERTAAIRRTLDGARQRKESAQSLRATRLKALRGQAGAGPSFGAGTSGNVSGSEVGGPARRRRKGPRSHWAGTDGETDAETDADGFVSESEFEAASVAHAPGESTVFLPGDAIFWLPYALTLVSRHPIYDLMRDYLTLSWARFSKDVQSHTLQISKILSHPAPRAGELIKLDASAKNDGPETSLEVIARFPGGMDFGRGLVDTNITMWPLFKALNVDNILTICEIALAPTGRILFFSRHPAMLGIAVSTIRYLVELRGWSGIALPAVHCRDAKIYIEDPGPWIIGLATEARYSVRPPPEVCIVDLDINYLNCPLPPTAVVSVKQQRDKFRQRLLAAFDPHYHPDHCVPSEFKEAFPAGRFRPVCKIQAKRGASPTAIADIIQPPDWWNSTRIIQAFDSVLQDRMKKPSFLRRISSFGSPQRPRDLSVAEQHIQVSIRKRATAFVDARDDLETKIGRLSRRLNFLMTESDLWRDKFVTFEQYAEKLSSEANDLRSKIGKEQRETKRLSTIVTSTAAEKSKLEKMLRDTENAHKAAVNDMEAMREQMDRMEEERAEMIAEVEAQIENALQSMAVGIDGSDDELQYDGASDVASINPPRSRKGSIPKMPSKRHLRAFPTETTLAESPSVEDVTITINDRVTDTVIEEKEEEEIPQSPMTKRFSAHTEDAHDAMIAVDEGISEKSDRITQKVLQIQQKLENALAVDRLTADRQPKWKQPSHMAMDSESEYSVDSGKHATRNRRRQDKAPSDGRAPVVKGHKKDRRKRGSVASSTSHATLTAGEETEDAKSARRVPPTITVNPRHEGASIPEEEMAAGGEASLPVPHTPSTPALTPRLGVSTSTDESDNDFQSAKSAYSVSPRHSYVDAQTHLEDEDDEDEEESQWFDSPREKDSLGKLKAPLHLGRARGDSIVSSFTATQGQPSPTFSEDTFDDRTLLPAVPV